MRIKPTKEKTQRSAWSWIPTLCFAEGIPNVVVVTVSVIMFKRLGLSNSDIALYTSWLSLPWVIKPFWSPIVDMFRTKRWWIVVMQLVIGAALGGVGLSLPLPFFFKASLIGLWILAFSSATHDIAADGFYMLALKPHDQAYFVGIRSTFYRLAMVMGSGLLIIFAGALETWTGLPPVQIAVKGDQTYETHWQWPESSVEKSEADHSALTFVVENNGVPISSGAITTARFDSIRAHVEQHNNQHGFISSVSQSQASTSSPSWWSTTVSQPFEVWLRQHFNPATHSNTEKKTGSAMVAAIRLNKSPEEGEEIVLNLRMQKDNDLKLISGDRLVFNTGHWSEPAYTLMQMDGKTLMADDIHKGTSGNIQLAWSLLFGFLSLLFICLALYHYFVLPYPTTDRQRTDEKRGVKEFFATFVTFFQKREIVIILSFLLLYRLGEAQLAKIASPFLLDARNVGGLGLSTSQLGLINGTIGLLMLTFGGIAGGLAAARKGLRFWLCPLVLLMNMPNALYIYMAYTQPNNLWIVGSCVAIEQFCYGFSFTAYMLYMIYVCDKSGTHKTAHYAICTGFMALGMMIPGMGAGWLQECIGYGPFFVWVVICALPAIVPLLFAKIDPQFGRK